jgi:uncharacterized membrane protein HdeD (DUF308 family)
VTTTAIEARSFPWWIVLIEGIAAAVVGALLIAAPEATLALVLQLLGGYWLVDGLLRIASAFADPADRGLKVEAGVIGVLAGIAVILRPLWLATMLGWMLVVALGGAGVVVGLLTLWHAVRGGGWGAAAGGMLSLTFGVLLLVNPLAHGAIWLAITGWLGLSTGIMTIGVSLWLRRDQARTASAPDAEAQAGNQAAPASDVGAP